MSTDQTRETPEAPVPPTPEGAPAPTEGASATVAGQTLAAEPSLRSSRLLLGVGLGVALVAVVVFALVGYRSFNLRLDAARQVDRATNLIEQSDTIVVDVDEVVRAEVTAGLDEKAEAALDAVEKAHDLLAEAVGLIDTALPDLNDEERERATLLRESATTRVGILEASPGLLELNAQAAAALPLAGEGWDALIEADKLSDKAVSSYNKLTKAGVRKSRTLNRDAAKRLKASKAKFVAAAEAFPAAQFDDHIAYVDARIALNRLSQRSDDAWLAGKIEKANDVIAQYNKKDKSAVAEAKDLVTPETLIATAFGTESKQLLDVYYVARDEALAADEALRTY